MRKAALLLLLLSGCVSARTHRREVAAEWRRGVDMIWDVDRWRARREDGKLTAEEFKWLIDGLKSVELMRSMAILDEEGRCLNGTR